MVLLAKWVFGSLGCQGHTLSRTLCFVGLAAEGGKENKTMIFLKMCGFLASENKLANKQFQNPSEDWGNPGPVRFACTRDPGIT